MTRRTTDLNGWLEVDGNPITKTGVFPYLGREIGAPMADKIYYVYRPAEELQKQETIDSFKLIPFVDEHTMLGLDATPAEQKGIQGMIGERVYYDAPYLRGNLKILSDSAQALIAGGKIELSPGYRCRYEFTPGSFDGAKYDAIQRDLRANHLALVQEGRTGKDVSVQDHFIITIDTSELVKMNLKEIKDAIAALTDEERAQLLSAISPDVPATSDAEEGESGMTDEEKAAAAASSEVSTTVVASAQTAAEAAAEAASTGDPAKAENAASAATTVAEQAGEAEELAGEAAAMDGLHKKIKRLEAALDSGAVMKSIANRDALAKQLSRFIGTFDHGALTSKQVAVYGVGKLGIKCAPGTESIALDAWMQGRTPDSERPSTVATDSRLSTNTIKSKWGK